MYTKYEQYILYKNKHSRAKFTFTNKRTDVSRTDRLKDRRTMDVPIPKLDVPIVQYGRHNTQYWWNTKERN